MVDDPELPTDRFLKPTRRMMQREYMRRYRQKHGNRNIQTTLSAPAAAGLLYLKKQWGIEGNREALEVAILHLTRLTRLGLKDLEIGIEATPEELAEIPLWRPGMQDED